MATDSGRHARAHGHMRLVGMLGLAAGLALMIYVPSLPAISSAMLAFAGFHLIGAAVLAGSLYVLAGQRVMRRRQREDDARFDFGWAPAWTYGPWIAALICGAASAALQLAEPPMWPLAMLLAFVAAAFFAGGLVTRAVGRYRDAVLPMVALLPRNEGLVLDAGCGAGRTTVALGRALKHARIVALDRFDADYIEGGGRSLLERNLRLSGLAERVEIKRGDLTALPFDEASFDAAVSAHAIDHLGPQTEAGLQEILRVLRPGAGFLLIVWVRGWTMFAVANVLSFFLSSERTWRRRATDADFAIADEGRFNGCWFAVLRKPQ